MPVYLKYPVARGNPAKRCRAARVHPCDHRLAISETYRAVHHPEDEENKEDKNLDLGKRLIELLELIKEKTKGNLKEEEEKFLDSCLHQLKLTYMEKAKIIKL